jgi:glycosyltransferase involved in cell wall biosynthesis
MHLGHSSDLLSGTGEERIGINAHLLSGEAGYRRAGIHQYISQVLRHLPREEDRSTYIIFTRQPDHFAHQPGITAVTSHWPTEHRLVRIAWEQLVWPWLIRRYKVRLLHSMAFVIPVLSTCPAVVTIYDLSFMHYPEQFPFWQQRYLASQTRRTCGRARRIIAISESSREDIHRFFGVPLPKIDVVLPGVDDAYQPLPRATIDAFRRQKGVGRFILHVGTLQPRKNIPTLLAALAQLGSPEIKLVLAGGKGWLYDEIFAQVQALGLTDRVIFTGYVPDDELPLWYNAAELFVFPSLYEGFGMPVLEAMACGTPVVAANSASIPEAVGDAGFLFDPHNSAELAERITAVLNDPDLSATMKQKGLAHARSFSWTRAGIETAAAYRRALKKE